MLDVEFLDKFYLRFSQLLDFPTLAQSLLVLRMRSTAAAIALLLVHARAAIALPIELVAARYTTHVDTTLRNFDNGLTTTQSRTQASSETISDYMYVDGVSSISQFSEAYASAGLFDVSVATASGLAFSNASADAHIVFTSLLDELTPLSINIGREAPLFTEGLVRLLDSTMNEVLWQYGWNFLEAGSIGFITVTNNIFFSSGHEYDLQMSTRSTSNTDHQYSRIFFTGLATTSVPEPQTILLLLPGLLAVSIRRRRT